MNRAFHYVATVLLTGSLSIAVSAQQADDARNFSKFNLNFFQDQLLIDNPVNELDRINNRYEQCLVTRDPRGDETWLYEYDQKKRVVKYTKSLQDLGDLVERTAYREDAMGRLVEIVVTSYKADMTVSEVKKSSFTYNQAGDVIAWTTPDERFTAAYDTQRRLISTDNFSNSGGKPYSRKSSYRYDEKGRLAEVKTISNYFNHLVNIVYTEQSKDGLRIEDAVVTTTELNPTTGKPAGKAPSRDVYRTVYDDRNNIVEYDHKDHFANYMFYDQRGLLVKKFHLEKNQGSLPSLTQFTYDSSGKVMVKTQHQLESFNSVQDYKLEALIERLQYNYQTGKVTRSGNITDGPYSYSIRCF